MSDLTLKDVASALERSAELEKRYQSLSADLEDIQRLLSEVHDERYQLSLLIAGFLVKQVPTLAGKLGEAIVIAQREQKIAVTERQ